MSARRRIPHWLMALVAGVAVVGCGDDSPVTPGREPLVFQGEMATGGFDSHPLMLERGGTVRVELAELTAIFLDITDLPADAILEEALGIGVGIGIFTLPDEETGEGGGECAPELRPTLTVGRVVTVLVSDDINCLAVFDPGTLPEDSLVGYTVVVTDAAG